MNYNRGHKYFLIVFMSPNIARDYFVEFLKRGISAPLYEKKWLNIKLKFFVFIKYTHYNQPMLQKFEFGDMSCH